MSVGRKAISLSIFAAVGFIVIAAIPNLNPTGWSHFFGEEPPPQLMAQSVAAPFNNTMNFTVASLAARLSQIRGMPPTWSKDTNGDYIFRIDGIDEMTRQPSTYALRFRDNAVIQMSVNGQYLSDAAILAQLVGFEASP